MATRLSDAGSSGFSIAEFRRRRAAVGIQRLPGNPDGDSANDRSVAA
ncbi:MAG: hypothetical protein ACFB12_09015 [Leptolyngbyaceae cyanobacterium]